MSIRFYTVLLIVIFIISSTSIGLLFFHMNPIPNPKLSLTLMGMGIFLAISSLLAPIIFFLKKIYYRGDVSISTMGASIRQAILLSLWGVFLWVLKIFDIHEVYIIIIAMMALLCVEVMFQALDS